MHTVRNRLASRPPSNLSFPAGRTVPTHQDFAYATRGSMAVPLSAPEESGLIETRAQRRRNPKGKKARKAAARLAAQREAAIAMPPQPQVCEEPRPDRRDRKKIKGKAKAKPADRSAAKLSAAAAKPSAVLPEQLPAIPARPLAEREIIAAPAIPLPAIPLPARLEPLVTAETPRVAALAAMPGLATEQRAADLPALAEPEPQVAPAAAAPDAFVLLPAPEPLVEAPPAPAEPDVVPEPEPATALAALADAPLPRARALVPARRQGLVDVIAFLLRDSGRRLARWSARRHKTREERTALRRAQARQINLQRELEALDALRRNKG